MAFYSVTFFFLFFSLSSLISQTQSSIDICLPPSYCYDDPYTPVKFPFHLKNHQSQSCGYNASFELSCNTHQNQTILNLPNLGDFIVQHIDYGDQILWLGDPTGCFVSRLLNSTYNHNFSPFRALGTKNFTFLNCSGEIASAGELEPYYEPVSCLGTGANNYTVLRVEEGRYNGSWSSCLEIKTVAAPLNRRSAFGSGQYDGIRLGWDWPDCRACAARGGVCGLKSGSDTEIGCIVFDRSSTGKSTGLPRSAKYGLIIGIGIPGLLCLIGLGCFICSKINYYFRCHRQRNAEAVVFSIPVRLQPFEVEMGLDRPTIESYPKTTLGQSGRLPKPNDTTCSICLSDYQPEETLRTIPECGHYFHIDCIDEWLKMRGTCPLCRNSPEGSIFTATSSSPSSSSLLSTSLA